MTGKSLETFPDLESASRRAADLTATAALEAVAARGRFSLALSGGSSPVRYFELLAAMDLPWDQVHVFWADERLLAPDSPDSNYRLARERLLSRAPIPEENVHPMRGAGWPGEPDLANLTEEGAAQAYEAQLRQFFGLGEAGGPEDFPAFDLIHLGLGGDGHTASLFPGQPALAERVRWVVSVRYAGASPPVPRLTLTLPVLNAARFVLFLASGKSKAELARAAFSGQGDYPAGLVRPIGRLVWLVGEA
jgi:6-phosphogluconolactonase